MSGFRGKNRGVPCRDHEGITLRWPSLSEAEKLVTLNPIRGLNPSPPQPKQKSGAGRGKDAPCQASGRTFKSLWVSLKPRPSTLIPKLKKFSPYKPQTAFAGRDRGIWFQVCSRAQALLHLDRVSKYVYGCLKNRAAGSSASIMLPDSTNML